MLKLKLPRRTFSKHIAVALSKDVDDLCKPLKEHFNIDSFFFQRDFCNVETGVQEAFAPLCNNAVAAEFTACDYEDTEPVPMYLNCQSNYFLNKVHTPKWVAAMEENCSLHHFITKSEKVEEGIWDRFVFATSSPDPKYLDFYLNNRDLLDKFVEYFKERAGKFIELATTSLVQSGHNAAIIDQNTIENEDSRNKFLSAIAPKQYYLSNREGSPISIPLAEMKCLLLLARGRSAKEIAQILGLSPRTVETNLMRSKTRLSCHSKKELLDIIEKNPSLGY